MGSVSDNLQNVQPPTINESLFTDGDIIQNMITNANTTTDGLWFVWSILCLWILIIWLLMDRNGPFQMDVARTLLISSGWCLIISVGAALFTLTTNIFPVFWFTSLVFLSGLMVMRRSEKGQ